MMRRCLFALVLVWLATGEARATLLRGDMTAETYQSFASSDPEQPLPFGLTALPATGTPVSLRIWIDTELLPPPDEEYPDGITYVTDSDQSIPWIRIEIELNGVTET